MSTTAIVVAAGQGKRMAASTKKQFLILGNKPVFIHAVERLSSVPEIDHILVVTAEEDVTLTRQLLETHSITKVTGITTGGRERQESVYRGILAAGDSRWILVHDGARPLVQPADVRRLIQEMHTSGAAILATPVKDTVKWVEHGRVAKTIPRERLWLSQTPQAFRGDLLREAHERALAENWSATDDASLVERAGWPVSIVPGSPFNLKITTPEDLTLAEALLNRGL
ncbi:MAG: 2-C-methyl-D-erythritol 4-phosphate cytidylyltransferase [Alicyclobacillaceae bacterium]|nr:2-C-methyl-D-erythritol 4-phosphate cytidylyltransferase [Alicyclobacillaceae bacterium]